MPNNYNYNLLLKWKHYREAKLALYLLSYELSLNERVPETRFIDTYRLVNFQSTYLNNIIFQHFLFTLTQTDNFQVSHTILQTNEIICKRRLGNFSSIHWHEKQIWDEQKKSCQLEITSLLFPKSGISGNMSVYWNER